MKYFLFAPALWSTVLLAALVINGTYGLAALMSMILWYVVYVNLKEYRDYVQVSQDIQDIREQHGME